MDDKEIKEIIEYVSEKYTENVPRPVRFFVRKKVKGMEGFDSSEIPASLRNCSIEQCIDIFKNAIRNGSLKL